jgi:hypothetical protein
VRYGAIICRVLGAHHIQACRGVRVLLWPRVRARISHAHILNTICKPVLLLAASAQMTAHVGMQARMLCGLRTSLLCPCELCKIHSVEWYEEIFVFECARIHASVFILSYLSACGTQHSLNAFVYTCKYVHVGAVGNHCYLGAHVLDGCALLAENRLVLRLFGVARHGLEQVLS